MVDLSLTASCFEPCFAVLTRLLPARSQEGQEPEEGSEERRYRGKGLDKTGDSGGFLIREGLRRGDYFGFRLGSATFDSTYTIENLIGTGGFGLVFTVRHKAFGHVRAMKRMKRSKAANEMQANELAALQALDHPHIVKFVEFYDEGKYLFLVFELCEGPSLLDHIMKSNMTENEAARALRHMLKALQCCHTNHRGHFDIKPENFMYSDRDCINLKMIDLGFSSVFAGRGKKTLKGTTEYMAPEFWKGIYGPEGDIWGCGLVLFNIVTREQMFSSEQLADESLTRSEVRLRENIKQRLSYAIERYGLSKDASDLMSWMLQYDRHLRPSVAECLKHSFIESRYRLQDDIQRCELPHVKQALDIRADMARFFRVLRHEPMLKRVARLAFAHFGPQCVAERLAFQMLDTNGHGELSISALELDFKRRRAEVPPDFESLFAAVDLNRDGYIGPLAFLSATMPASVLNDNELCKAVFGLLDRDKSGFIDAHDLGETFNHAADSDICATVMDEVCEGGRLLFEQFATLMHVDEHISSVVEDSFPEPDLLITRQGSREVQSNGVARRQSSASRLLVADGSSAVFDTAFPLLPKHSELGKWELKKKSGSA